MTINGARRTAHRTAAATVAASDARRRRAAERDAVQLAERVGLLSNKTVADLAEWFVVNCRQRGLTVPDLLEEEWEDEQRGAESLSNHQLVHGG